MGRIVVRPQETPLFPDVVRRTGRVRKYLKRETVWQLERESSAAVHIEGLYNERSSPMSSDPTL
jgi:hypothetical protein